MRLLPLAVALAVLATPASAHVLDPRPQPTGPAMFAQQPLQVQTQRQASPANPPATPRAECRPGDRTEPSIQGRLPAEEVTSGRADEGYWCNIDRVGHIGRTGGFKVLRYVDRNGHECAYYDTALLFPTNALNLGLDLTGVAVLDMSDPRNPKRATTLLTPAMQSPHESLNISVERGILAAVAGNPAFAPGLVDVYDISNDCRRPELLSTLNPAGHLGHESGMAIDGKTFYATSIGSGHTTAVGLDDPRFPQQIWQGRYNTHGMTLSDDGTRGYLATGDGLVIVDLTEVQQRRPDPQVREISRLTWPNMTIPQIAHPVTIDGRQYLVEVDEYSTGEGGRVGGHGPVVGAARIIDISDETEPRVVSDIRLDVHQRESRGILADDPGAQSPVQGYAAHYCSVPSRVDPGIVACSMIISGLRVFDIRDPENPKEIAYHYAPPSTVSETGFELIDERSNWAMSQPAFVPERGEIWYSDGQAGFYALKMDPSVWPFPDTGCEDGRGFTRVFARPRGRRLRVGYVRRAELPVEVDVFRVSRGRRVLGERVLVRLGDRGSAFTWRPRGGAGTYSVRFRMLQDGRSYETRRVVVRRTRSGRFKRVPSHSRPSACGLIARAELQRPVFGGRSGAPLRLRYALARRSRVTITVLRGGRVVRRYPAREVARGTLKLRAKGLERGLHRVRIQAAAGEETATVTLASRRL